MGGLIFMKQKENLIAIIGMACRFPGSSNSVKQFWNNLKNGKDCVTDVPGNRWSINEFYHHNKKIPGKSHSKCGGFIDNFDEFDAPFFGVNTREAEQIDPQQRQLLEITWEAFEDADLKPCDYVRSRTGVFIGGFTLDYKILQFADTEGIGTHTAVGSMMTMLSNRISYVFDFRGPSMSIDTACSSSLVSLHEACQSLKNNECDMAVAGGMELIYTPEYYIAESKGGFLSVDGRCKTFDAQANGYVRGEGGGILILKKLDAAIKDKNNIYAVIRESMVNQDGKTVGISVPNGEAQKMLLEDVYGRAGIKPKDVQYVEVHGTGTSVGDPIEANVVAGFFGAERDSLEGKCIISSVKANIGHLEAASGIASIIKAVCSMQENIIAPHIGMKELNPKIDIDKLSIRIPERLEPWPKDGKTKIVGVNSFGFGGTNAHVILQEYHEEDDVECNGTLVNPKRPKVLNISAKSEYSLKKMVEKYTQLMENTETSVDTICYNVATKREKHNVNITVIGDTKEELIENLYKYTSGQECSGVRCRNESKDTRIVFVFTGMGPQWYAMGRELYNTDRVFKETVCKLDKEFSKYLSWSIVDEMMLDEATSRISRTDVAQPMNFVIQVALSEMWKSMGIVPDLIIGHSVGEVAAFYVAGVYDLDEAIRISYLRSRCQYRLTGKGGMLAVGLSEEEAQKYMKGMENSVSIAAINSNTSVTMAGEISSLENIATQLEEKLIFNRFLNVNIPYHSIFMNEIKDDFLESIGELHPQKSKVSLYTTADGELSDGTNLDKWYWWKNISQAVHFSKAITRIIEAGYINFVEVGPHPVLAKSIKEIADELKSDAIIVASLIRKQPEMRCMFQAYADLINAGCNVDLSKVYSGTFKTIKLPIYQWEHKRYWKEPMEHQNKRLGLKDHPLLGYRTNSAVPLWEAEINDYELPFVKDHRINGQGVIAGAHYIETAFQLLKSQCEKSTDNIYEILDIRFLKAVFLDENNVTHISINYDKQNGLIRIFSNNVADRKTSVLNFETAVRRRQISMPVEKFDIIQLQKRCSIEMTGSKCYEVFKNAGFEYGTAFQGIKNAWIGENETLCELCSLEEIGNNDFDSVLHPSILDASFQSMILNQYKDANCIQKDDLKLPISIDRITVYRKSSARLYAHAYLLNSSEQEIVGDITLFDDEGSVVAQIKGFTARTLENDNEHAVLSERDLYDWSYRVEWRERNNVDDEPLLTQINECDEWIIFSDSNGIGEKVAEMLQNSGRACRLIYGKYQNKKENLNSISLEDKSAYDEICNGLEKNIHYGILFMCGCDVQFYQQDTTIKDITDTKTIMLNPIRHIVNTFNERNINYHMWVVTQNAVEINYEDKINVNQAPAFGMCRVIAQNECITTWGANIDVDGTEEALEMLCYDLKHLSRENEIAYRKGKRYTSRLMHIQDMSGFVPLILDKNKYYILSGGLGSLGQITANWLVEKGACNIILLGRSKVSPENPKDEQKNIFLDNLAKRGVNVKYISLDIQDENAVKEFITNLKRQENAVIGGVFHIAGVLRDELIMSMTQEQFDEVYDPKSKGAWNLSKCTWDENLDFFVTYSSAGAVVSSVGQVNYAAGNAFMDALAFYRRSIGQPGQSIGWGPWGVGMIEEMKLTDYYKNVRGMEPIYSGTGMQALERVLGQNETHVVICGTDWTKALTNYPGKPPLFNHLDTGSEKNKSDEDEEDILDALALKDSMEERIQRLADFFIDIVSEITYTSRELIYLDEPLNVIGVDSIIASEIRNKISEKCGITIAITDILGGLSLNKIANKSYELLLPQIESRRNEYEKLLNELENMSDEDVKNKIGN